MPDLKSHSSIPPAQKSAQAGVPQAIGNRMNGILTGERQKGPPPFIAVIASIGVRLH
jgi:hypothetical protein